MVLYVGQIIWTRSNDDNVVNRVHLEHGALDKDLVADALVAATVKAWNGGPSGSQLRDLMPNVVRPNEVKVYDVGPPPNSPVVRTTGLVSGGAQLQSLPPQVAAVVTLDALSGGRRGRGRMYIGPLGPAVLAQPDGRLSTTTLTALRGALTEFIAELNAAGVLLVIRSTIDGVGRIVRQVRVDNTPDTQRRRGFNLATEVATTTGDLQAP